MPEPPLRQALQPGGNRSEAQRAAIERLGEIRRRSPLPAGAPTSDQLVREDRDTAGYVLLAIDLDAELVTADLRLADAAVKKALPVRRLTA